MNTFDPSAALPESYWKPKDSLEGQKRINGQLCRVDQMLIEILRQIKEELAKLTKRDLRKIDALLEEVSKVSSRVPAIEPPGCEPSYPFDPRWKTVPEKLSTEARDLVAEKLSVEIGELVAETALAHERTAVVQAEIEQLKAETRTTLTRLSAA